MDVPVCSTIAITPPTALAVELNSNPKNSFPLAICLRAGKTENLISPPPPVALLSFNRFPFV
jgi:hypothetical protein